MNSRLSVDIGGLPISLSLRRGSFSAEVMHRYRLFFSRTRPRYDVALNPVSRRLPFPWEPSIAAHGAALRLRASQFQCELDGPTDESGFRRGRGRVRDNGQGVDSLLRVLTSVIGPLEGGVLLHAAAFVRRGGAFLFAGPSGAGKTTLMRRLAGSRETSPLSDELVLLRRDEDGFRVFSTPFWGEFRRPRRNGSAPLRGVFFLEKSKIRAPRPEVTPLTPGEAQKRLLRCLVTFQDERAPLESSWDLLLDALRRTPAALFRWHKDAGPADLEAAIR